MSRVKLSIATTDYDHFRDLRLGGVQAEGIEPTWSMRHAAGTSSRTLRAFELAITWWRRFHVQRHRLLQRAAICPLRYRC